MVAGTPRDHAARCLQAGDLVDRAAKLERARPLEVLRLQHDAAAALLGEAARTEQRRMTGELPDDPPSSLRLARRQACGYALDIAG